jgi:cell division GTPase FtsZ
VLQYGVADSVRRLAGVIPNRRRSLSRGLRVARGSLRLKSGVACISDLVVKEGLINLDFADVRAVMREMGKAMMGTGEASGDKRARDQDR